MHDWKREGGLLEGMITGLQIEWAVCLRIGERKIKKRMLVMKQKENNHLQYYGEHLSVNSDLCCWYSCRSLEYCKNLVI